MTEQITYANREFSATIAQTSDNTWKLTWTDYVANEWDETFEALEIALVRLALLVRATQRDEFFSTGPDQFERAADAFLTSQLS